MADFVDYSLLGVTPDAESSEIRDAFRSAAQAWHADRWVTASQQHRTRADEMMKRINAAHEILRDSRRRAEYDDALRIRRGPEATTTRARSATATGVASERDEVVLSCPYCNETHKLPRQSGGWMRLPCRGWSSWPPGRTVSAGARTRRDVVGLSASFACWLAAFLVLRPAIGDPLYIASILVATPMLAFRKRAGIARWLGASLLTAGAATFLLASLAAPASATARRPPDVSAAKGHR